MDNAFSWWLFRRLLAFLAYAVAWASMFMPKELALPCLPVWVLVIFVVDAGDCLDFPRHYLGQ